MDELGNPPRVPQTPPVEGEVGEALRAGWVGRASESQRCSPPRRLEDSAATSPSRGEVKKVRFVFAFLALCVAVSEVSASSASDTLSAAESAFAEGVALRSDS